MAGMYGLKLCMHLEYVFLNTMAKPQAILSGITGDIAILLLRGWSKIEFQRDVLRLYKFTHI